MNKFQFKLLFILFIFPINLYAGSSLTANVIGSDVRWMNANVIGDDIVEQIWRSSSSFPLLPIYEWRPAFNKSPINKVTFNSSLGFKVETEIEHSGVQFRSASPFTVNVEPSGFSSCDFENTLDGYFALSSKNPCAATYSLKSSRKYKAYDFFRSAFKLNNLINDFKSVNAPSGVYYANITIPISYMVKYGSASSYQTNTETVNFIINYTPSFLSSVNIIGDGVLELDYNTSEHSVKGNTKFNVSVNGHVEPGLKMTFTSSGVEKDFKLENKKSSNSIPYGLICNLCEKPQVIYKGHALDDYSIIPFVGNNLNFNLKFYFDDVYVGRVDEGDYSDAISIRFEVDL
ncbi:hypothetical protein [Aliivibrio fischeri]|uniref:hypothetical protein n=1 Tax=Aliivibrio fischeri TaxID=668 RepID=UPI00080E19EC|nr:hypothetical protein [Aliivibrio fischeri]OCH48156.1 hypothetical protein A6E02_08480 [Aliivibrio fischeri]